MTNKTCGGCKYFSKYENKCCLLVGRGVTYADSDGCMSFVQKLPKAITNGDVIRHLSNEELAERFAFPCPPLKKHCNGNNEECLICWLNWLNAPAESEGKNE